MKNIFSKNSAEKRTWNGSKSVQLRSIYGISILIFAFLTLGFGRAWAEKYYNVGVAATNASNYTMKVGVTATGWSWYTHDMTKAGLTFEGKKLYLNTINTPDSKLIGEMKFLLYSGDDWKGESVVLSSWTETDASTFDNKIWNYESSGWYSTQTIETGAKFYFDASNWTQTSIKLVVGHANYQRYSSLTNVPNTKLYYGSSGNKWTDAMHIGVVGNTSASDGANWPTDISDKASEYTGLKNYGLKSTGANNAYLMVNAGKAGQQPSMSYNDSYTTLLHSTQTIESYVSTDNGSSYTKANSKATISITSYQMNGQGSTTSSNGSLSTSASSTTVTSARTATTTVSVGSVAVGYVFVGWYDSSNNLLSSETSYTYYPTGATTICARFKNETVHQVAVTYVCASPSTTVKPAENPYVGEITSSTFTAGTPKGFTFSSWTVGDGLTITSGSTSTNSISVKTKSSGTYTLRANYTEDLSANCYLRGDWTNGWTTTGQVTMSKKTGHSTEDWVYCTQTFTASESTIHIKIYDNDAYYGAESSTNTMTKQEGQLTSGEWSLATPGNDINFKHNWAGTYEFKYNLSTHKLIVTYPEFNQLRVSAATPSDATNVNNFNLSDPSSNVRTKTLTLNANTTYTFKIVYLSDWYGNNSGAYTRSTSTSSASKTLNTSGGNLTLTTDYAGDYTFKFNQSTKTLSIDFPEAYQIHFERGAINGGKVSSYPIATQVETSTSVTSDVTWVKAGNTVTLTAAEVKDGGHYIWYGWYTVQNPDRANPSTNRLGTSLAYTTPAITSASNKNFYAVYFETEYWVNTWVDGQGTISPAAGQNAYIETLSGNFTASPGTGYKFDNWTQSSGALTITSPSSTTTTVNATAASVLQANFSPRWSVMVKKDGGEWCATNANLLTDYGEGTIGYADITLDANSNYEIKIYDRQNSTWYGGSVVQNIDYSHSGLETVYTIATTSTPYSVYLQSAAAGTYRFAWNLTGYKIAVQYPTSWFITSGQKTEGQDDNAGGSFTAEDNNSNDVKGGKFVANNASVTFTATPNTGYTFDGWYTNADCTEDKNTSNPMTVSSITADKTVYAKFVPKTYTVALTNTGTGYGSGGAASVTATFNQILPAPASLPTAANGYAFMGYYSAANGKGSQFTDASGTWTTSVTDTISDSKWVLDAGATLYAYYKKAEVTELALSASVVGTTIEDSITVTPTISPTPVAPTIICWEVQYSDETPLDPQPEGRVVSGNTYRFKAPTASGSYKIKCILSTGSSCLGETELSNRSANFTVAGAHVVTVIYKCGDEVIAASSKVAANPLESAEVSAPDVFGYSFSSWTAGEGVSLGSSSSTNPNTVTAIYDGTLTANYSKKKIIFLKNTLNWPAPHVYFYKDEGYWDASKGAGCDGDQCLNRRYAHAMINIDGTDIWYYDYSGQGWADQVTRYMAFTDNNFSNHVNFNGARVIYATSYTAGFSEGTPMFIPLADQTKDVVGGSDYYSKGYWINYIGEGTGYTLRVYNSDGSSLLKTQKFTSADKLMAMKATVDLEAGTTYKFELLRDNNMVHGNTGTILPSAENEAWEFTHTTGKCGVKTAAAGDYTFTLTYSNHDLKIAIDYPSSKGDYRLVYKDLAGADYWSSGSAHTAAWSHPSRVITRSAGAEDIVSFFIVKGASPTVTFQRISAVSSSSGSEGAVTWVDSTVVDLNSLIDKTGYYNLVLKQSDPAGTISIERIEPYTGEFYIRTAKANNGWDNYVANDHLMHYSSYAEKHSDDHYSHYFVKYIENGANIKFVIANDYSPCISDTVIAITGEPISTNEYGFMSTSEEGVNIRFMWNKATNTLGRAYLTGPVSNQYFVLRALTSDGKTFRTWTDATHHTALGTLSVTESGNSYTVDTLCFIDNQNWVYQADLYAKPSATYKLVAKVNGHETFFRGKEGGYSTADNLDELLGGSGSDAYHIRLIYDFKHDRMMKAWMPSGNIGLEVAINADVMIVRNHQEAAQQVTFSESGKLTEVKTVYGCMQFNRWILNNRSTTGSHPVLDVADQKTIYERSLYFISFPFDVNVNEIFGFGTYWDEWYIEYYDGLNRAKNGYWKDSPPNWKYVTPEMASTFKLKANEGYILGLDLDFMESDNTDFWSNGIETVALYFPSDGEVTNIQATTAQIPALSDEYYCSINRNTPEGDRRVKDSYWRCIGVPSYANYNIALQDGSSQTITWKTGSTLPYLYAWNMTDNTLTPQATSTFNFKAMHSYLVQYAGVINWTAVSAPKLAPARYNEALADREFRLELQQGENIIDQTFVRLSMDEMVTSGFEFDHDMVKELNNGKSNIYTMISAERAAANMLPLSTTQTTVVPVGIQIAANGEYTLAMPDGTHGVGVTLVDNETGIRTPLGALDYTVTLQPGDYTGRFVLEISPIQNTPTGLEAPTSDSSLKGRAQKVMIDGILYIVKDGKIFDARGARVQ